MPTTPYSVTPYIHFAFSSPQNTDHPAEQMNVAGSRVSRALAADQPKTAESNVDDTGFSGGEAKKRDRGMSLPPCQASILLDIFPPPLFSSNSTLYSVSTSNSLLSAPVARSYVITGWPAVDIPFVSKLRIVHEIKRPQPSPTPPTSSYRRITLLLSACACVCMYAQTSYIHTVHLSGLRCADMLGDHHGTRHVDDQFTALAVRSMAMH